MYNRSVIKNIFLIGLFAVIVIAGIVIFVELTKNKRALDADLYNYIPSGISGILQVNKADDSLYPLYGKMEPVITCVGSSLVYPFLLIEYDASTYIMSKVTEKQKEQIVQKLEARLTDYPPGEKIYKGNKLFFYPASDDGFFICMFYGDFFVGGYNIGLFEEIIDLNISGSRRITDSPLSRATLAQMKKHYPANLFLNNQACFSVFNIGFTENKTELEGYDTSLIDNNWICADEVDEATANIAYPIFPDSLNYYQVEMYNPVVTDSFKCFFAPPSYTFNMPVYSDNLYALRHIGSKFVIYNVLNDLEEKYTKKRFDINDFCEGYRIYTTSAELAKEVFGFDKRAYMVFYKDFLIFGKDKDALKGYLRQNGKYKPDCEADMSDPDFASFFYSSDINKWNPDFFSSKNPINFNAKKEACMTSYLDGEKRKTKIFIIN